MNNYFKIFPRIFRSEIIRKINYFKMYVVYSIVTIVINKIIIKNNIEIINNSNYMKKYYV